MYCRLCKELICCGDELTDLDNYTYPYYYQVCPNCRIKNKYTSEELRLLLNIEKKDWEFKDES